MRREHKEAILERLDAALKDTYHNATVHIPGSIPDNEIYEFSDHLYNFVFPYEIEYIRDGLGVDGKHWERLARKGLIHPTEYKFYLVSRATKFGDLYQWGRGGRTLAPDRLVRQTGAGRFRIPEAEKYEDWNALDMVELIQILEAFNQYVKNGCSQEAIESYYRDWKEDREQEVA